MLVSTLPPDLSAPVIIAQHLDPHHESHLGEILARKSTLPVRTVTEREPLEAGVVFVVPSNRHVNVTDSAIDPRIDSRERPKPSINLLLGSAAEVIGEGLIAIILTGTGSDGAEGAAAVKKAGGTVIIQNPETAEYPGMPMSLAPNTVDIVAELDRIGPVLKDLLAGIEAPAGTDEESELRSLLHEVRERNGIDFSSYKTPTIMRRLQRRIVATGSQDIEGYNLYVREHSEEYQQLVSSFLINVTEFFRDAEMFEYLKTEVIPRLIEDSRENGNQLRLWSAGCATGEEAYSLAILVAEALGDELGQFNVRVFATDIDDEAISFARQGIYARSTLTNVSEDLINRYFVKENSDYQVNKMIRGLVIFGQHDLARRSPFPRIDMVICRNVLIYFTATLQKRALQLFAYSLRDSGRLVLGKAESTSPLSEFFAPEDRQRKVYRRRGDRFLMPPALLESPAPTTSQGQQSPGGQALRDLAPVQQTGTDQRANRLFNNLLLKLPVGVVVVDRRYDIQLINNVARGLLSIHSPATGEDLIHLVQGAAYTTLRSAIDTAFREDDPTHVGELAIEEPDTGEPHFLRMIVRAQSVENALDPSETVMIFIQDITDLARARNDLADRLQSVTGELEKKELLNERLTETNRHVDEANQELTRINEDLRTTNEELLLSTEEAQAATEEVETLNEELQATNEELETLNEELQATVEELNATTDDLQARSLELQVLAREGEREQSRMEAILDSMDVAVLVVDAAGRDVFTNATYERLFSERGLVAGDESGEPLPSEAAPRQRATQGEPFNMEFTAATRDGGQIRFQATGGPVHYDEDDGQGGIILIRIVTKRE